MAFIPPEILKKIEYYCAYQERCQKEVVEKLYALKTPPNIIDEILVHLIQENFINEERFACAYARGKHYMLGWGKNRIINELKFRNITNYLINKALLEINDEDYDTNFLKLAQKTWTTIHEKNILKKKKKLADTLLRKGYETDLIYRFLDSHTS